MLVKKYPSVKKMVSSGSGNTVISNSCIHCGVMQSSRNIHDDLLDLQDWEGNVPYPVDDILQSTLEIEDIEIHNRDLNSMTQDRERGEVHHRDRNRHNNDDSNLVLLCVPCHNEVHREYRNAFRQNNSNVAET